MEKDRDMFEKNFFCVSEYNNGGTEVAVEICQEEHKEEIITNTT